jgi:uncharacterized protein YqhQ
VAEEKPKFQYGGQAVIEGVMMRGRKDFAVVVRKADGEIVTTKESVETTMGRFKWLDKPFLRGTLALIDSMALGIKALMFSANIAMADAVEADNSAKQKKVSEVEKTEAAATAGISELAQDEPKEPAKVNDIAVKSVMVLGMVFGVALFMFIPIVLTKLFDQVTQDKLLLTLVETVIKFIIFLGYLLLISRMKDIQRVFEYHGAEHKTINAYEAGEVLTVENVAKYPKAHPRCGTSFILVVLLASFVVFIFVNFLPYGSLADRSILSYFVRWGYKLLLLPFVTGIAYEVIRYSGRHKDSAFARMLVYPGILTQKITTREPEPAMIEVAIKSLESVLEKEAEDKKIQQD